MAWCFTLTNLITILYLHGLTFAPWIINHMPSEVCDEITCPSPNFNGAPVEVWKWIGNFILHFIIDVIMYPCYPGAPLIKGSPYWGLNKTVDINLVENVSNVISWMKNAAFDVWMTFQLTICQQWLGQFVTEQICLPHHWQERKQCNFSNKRNAMMFTHLQPRLLGGFICY